MNKLTKKAWIERISGETVALVGSVFGWSLDRVKNTIDNWDANAIKYTDGKINGGRVVKKVRSKDIVFHSLAYPNDNDSYLQTTGGEWYVYTCKAGEFMIAYFPVDVEQYCNAVVYAVSKTGK